MTAPTFFLNGDLHQANATGAVNLTETRRAEARQQQLAAVSVDDMVVFAPDGPVARAHSPYLLMSPVSIVKSFTVRWTSSMPRDRSTLSRFSSQRH